MVDSHLRIPLESITLMENQTLEACSPLLRLPSFTHCIDLRPQALRSKLQLITTILLNLHELIDAVTQQSEVS